MDKLRDTRYAKELKRATVQLSGADEARLERLFIKAKNREEVRFSWWSNGKMARNPLDVSEAELLELLKEGIKEEVFSNKFLEELKTLLDQV